MSNKYYQPIDQLSPFEPKTGRQTNLNQWKVKMQLKQQKKYFQKRIFGEHYNYSKIGLNKEKKYMIEEQRNTQIQRSNRILLEKIQRISKRSVPIGLKRKNYTQEPQIIEKQDLIDLLKNNSRQEKVQSNIMRSFDNLNIANNLMDSRISKIQKNKKIIFRGKKQIDGQNCLLSIFIENNKYTILSQYNKTQQKIQMELDSYKQLLSDYLDKNHLNIFNILTFNGSALELTGIDNQISHNLENEQVLLPQNFRNKSEEQSNFTPKNF